MALLLILDSRGFEAVQGAKKPKTQVNSIIMFLQRLFWMATLTAISSQVTYGTATTEQYYFAYGSNLSYSFLKERLKNGKWINNWQKDGELEGEAPIDHGCYRLDGYKFGYTLNVVPFGEEGTAGNIVAAEGSAVFGVLYKISKAHLHLLDESEEVPIAYSRVAVKVNRVATPILVNAPLDGSSDLIEAWAYVGNPDYVVKEINPDPEYVNLLIRGAKEHHLPEEYIQNQIELPAMALTGSDP